MKSAIRGAVTLANIMVILALISLLSSKGYIQETIVQIAVILELISAIDVSIEKDLFVSSIILPIYKTLIEISIEPLSTIILITLLVNIQILLNNIAGDIL